MQQILQFGIVGKPAAAEVEQQVQVLPQIIGLQNDKNQETQGFQETRFKSCSWLQLQILQVFRANLRNNRLASNFKESEPFFQRF